MVTERNWLVMYEPFERWTGRTIPEFLQGQEFVPSVLTVSSARVFSRVLGPGGVLKISPRESILRSMKLRRYSAVHTWHARTIKSLKRPRSEKIT